MPAHRSLLLVSFYGFLQSLPGNFKTMHQNTNVARSLLDDIKTIQLQWYGHVQRMEEGRLPKEVMKWSPPGRRKQGRPKLYFS